MLFLTSSNNFVVQHWIKYLDKAPKKLRLTFIPTAGEVEKGDKQWLKDDQQALVDVGFIVTEFTFTGKSVADTKAMLDTTDIVFISGGNTFFLLQEMRKSGFDKLIKKYLKKGLIYGGSSAGSVVAGPDISLIKELDDPKLAPELTDYTGLNLTDVIVFPHWGSENFAKRYQKLMKSGYARGSKIILLTDDQYLFVEDEKYRIESV